MNSHLRPLCSCLALAVSLLAAAPAWAETLQYNLTRDFSTNQNPNGVWSYNYNSSPIASFQNFWWGEGGWGSFWIGDGCILKGSPPTGTDPWGNPAQPPHDWQPGDVMMHALSLPYGGDSTFLNVTWTCPADGTIDIAGRAWEGDIFSDRDVAWTLSVAGRVIAQRSSVQGLYRADGAADFSANLLPDQELTDIRVSKGDVVEFRVATDTYYGHFVGVQETITLTTRRTLPTTPRAARLKFDLKRNWSDTQNPHGAWSYNYNATPIATHQTFWWGGAGWGDNWLGDGAILKGNPPTGTDPWGNPITPPHDWQPGDVMMHALSIPYGGDATFLNVTWTSPADGIIDIAGRAWEGEIFDDREVSWALLVRGQAIATRSAVRGLYRTDPGANFAANRLGTNSLTHIRVAKGDVVEFRVITETYYGHFVGLEQTIILKTRGLAAAINTAQSRRQNTLLTPIIQTP